MNPKMPDIELFLVIKWIFLLMLSTGLAQYSALWVKRKWYGGKDIDRSDNSDPAAWIERFLEMQKEYTAATVMLGTRIQQLLDAIEKNGLIIAEFTRAAECKYDPKINGERRKH